MPIDPKVKEQTEELCGAVENIFREIASTCSSEMFTGQELNETEKECERMARLTLNYVLMTFAQDAYEYGYRKGAAGKS